MSSWFKVIVEALGFVAKNLPVKRRPKPGPDVKPLDAEELKRKSENAKVRHD